MSEQNATNYIQTQKKSFKKALETQIINLVLVTSEQNATNYNQTQKIKF